MKKEKQNKKLNEIKDLVRKFKELTGVDKVVISDFVIDDIDTYFSIDKISDIKEIRKEFKTDVYHYDEYDDGVLLEWRYEIIFNDDSKVVFSDVTVDESPIILVDLKRGLVSMDSDSHMYFDVLDL